ncbi:MAG: arginine deiminase family protein [Acidobacteriota bacterium]|nr:arginine deiminase family protein [Acidobacteriota bacterium]
MTTFQSDVRPIRRLVLKHARDAFLSQARVDAQWQELNYLDRPDFIQSVADYDKFAGLMEACGIEIHYLAQDNTLTMDSLYPRDAAIATDRGMILCNMGKPARRDEPTAKGRLFEKLDISVLGRIQGEGYIEGGDVAWVDEHTLAVGRGYRTNDEGIRQLRALLDDSVDLVTVPLPHYKGPADVFHLMSFFSPIDTDLAVVYSALMPVPFRELLLARGYQLVEVPDEEWEMACNVLAVAPRKVVALEGFPITRKLMEEAGAEVLTYPGAEISQKGCGGPTCMTRPLDRE